jgi:hypothetical protein
MSRFGFSARGRVLHQKMRQAGQHVMSRDAATCADVLRAPAKCNRRTPVAVVVVAENKI